MKILNSWYEFPCYSKYTLLYMTIWDDLLLKSLEKSDNLLTFATDMN